MPQLGSGWSGDCGGGARLQATAPELLQAGACARALALESAAALELRERSVERELVCLRTDRLRGGCDETVRGYCDSARSSHRDGCEISLPGCYEIAIACAALSSHRSCQRRSSSAPIATSCSHRAACCTTMARGPPNA